MKKQFNVNGNATRSEFWAVTIISCLVLIAACVVGGICMAFDTPGIVIGSLIILVSIIAYTWLVIATTIRRCKDADINPFWTAACFLPYIGWVVYIVLGCLQPVKTNA